MTLSSQPLFLTPEEVEIASGRDGKRYEQIDGELKEKIVGFEAAFIATRIAERLNAAFYPKLGIAVPGAMIYCFDRKNRGRKPDVVFTRLEKLPNGRIPKGDLRVAPDLVAEVISPGNSGLEVEEKINEYLEAGISLVWIVNPEQRTIRAYRQDGTTRLFRAADMIEGESLLPGFRLVVGEMFPEV